MTFPSYHNADTTKGTAAWDATSFAVPMPANAAPGNGVIILVLEENGDGTNHIAAPSGWNGVVAQSNSNQSALSAYWKILDGNEGSTVAFSKTQRVAQWAALRISGNHASVFLEIAAFAIYIYDAPWNPPALTVSWGVADTLWIAVGGKHNGWLPAGNPTNYIDGDSSVEPGTAGPIAWAFRQYATETEDPPAFDFGTDEYNWGGVMLTIGVRPGAGAPPPGDLTGTASATFTATGTLIDSASEVRIVAAYAPNQSIQ